jgi:hypothetical protein
LANTAYTGLEDADKESLSSQSLAKSAMFKSTYFTLLINISYIIILAAVTLVVPADVTLVSFWGLAVIGTYLSTFVLFSYQTKKTFKCAFPFRFLLKNIVILSIPAIAMFLPFLLLKVTISANIYQMILNLLPSVLISLALYAAFLYVIEKRFRMIVRDSLKKIRLLK